ncbi:MAG: heme exporter protein CcmB [Acidobacteriaceae bacterium]|nr:heme exporter protein CcmB [Acidobacteriaceae bacterium]MBV9781112.1 heme exporter protein CcmB [Acidobacteriaceae bacterium]
MRSLLQALSIARKDLTVELRTKESLNAAIAFSVVMLLLFSFAFDPAADVTREIAAGLLWIVFAFSGALIFNRAFVRELPNDCLDVLLSSPISPASLLLGKAAAIFVLLLFLEAISLVVFGVFYNLRWWLRPIELALVCILASWGISILGAVFGALTVNLRLRELMLPVIIYPILIPLLIAAVELTDTLFRNQPLSPDQLLWGRLLVVFDVVFTALALALAEAILVN